MSEFPQWDEKILENRLMPKWALPKNSKTNKLHCFVDSISLCGNHTGYKEDSVEESGVVYERPNTICQKCFKRWRLRYNTES